MEYENLLDNKDSLMICDFLYADYRNLILEANRCHIFKGVGMLFFQNDKKIAEIKGDVLAVSPIEIKGKDSHFYIKIKTNFMHEGMYLIRKSSKRKPEFSIGERVVRIDNEDSAKIYFSEKKKPGIVKSLRGAIEKEFEWELVENIENRIVKIRKENEEMYCFQENLVSIDEILLELRGE